MNSNYITLKNLEYCIRIQKASNMLEVSQFINDAILDHYNLRHPGLIKIQCRKLGLGDIDIDAFMNIRYEDMRKDRAKFVSYLSQFIPQRMHSSKMYENLQLGIL